VLYEYGGVYLDTDVVVVRRLDDLDSALGFEKPASMWSPLNGAMLVFKQPRHPFIFDCIVEINNTYRADKWGWNGPLLFTRVWRERWEKQRPNVITALEVHYFQLFHYRKIRSDCFNNASNPEVMFNYAKKLALRIPYAVHINNGDSQDEFELRPGTLCEYLLTRFCVFCSTEPAKPAAYGDIAFNGSVISLP
jgi:lactosylceramide 4-alpha-galactosyltransferase